MNSKKLATVVFLLASSVAVGEQLCSDQARSSASGARFSVDPAFPELARHIVSDLTWRRCPAGFELNTQSTETTQDDSCDPLPDESDGRFGWSEAYAVVSAENPTLAISGWRLPSLKELMWLVEFRCVRPAQNTGIFPATGHDIYWTSTPFRNNLEVATVNFSIGSNDTARKDTEHHAVRLVASDN